MRTGWAGYSTVLEVPVSRLAGRVCVVNGAASEIGQAVARRFASEGGVVAGVDKAEHSVGEHVVRADLVDESQVEAMYEQVVRRYGRLDVIYNNMGLMDRGDRSALDTSVETWRRVLDANLTSIFLSCKHGIRHLRTPTRLAARSSMQRRSSRRSERRPPRWRTRPPRPAWCN